MVPFLSSFSILLPSLCCNESCQEMETYHKVLISSMKSCVRIEYSATAWSAVKVARITTEELLNVEYLLVQEKVFM